MDTITIPNINNYTQEIIDGTLVLTPLVKEHNLLNDYNLLNSKIKNCYVTNHQGNTIITKKKKYQSILTDIWAEMPVNVIFKESSFNFKLTNENGKKGYCYIPKCNFSVQSKSADLCLKEIIKMCKINRYKICISIELDNGNVINFEETYR